MPTISQEIRAEVAKRPTALVLKTSCATHSRSSNLLLGVSISQDKAQTKIPKVISSGINTKDFKRFLTVQKNLTDKTTESHIVRAEVFLRNAKTIDTKSIQKFMLWVRENRSPQSYRNYLSTLKVLIRDYLKQPELIQDFKFPKQHFAPKILPSKEQLRIFYEALPMAKYKILFLMLGSSGLRLSETLSSHIDRTNCVLIPKSHGGQTKSAWVSFYNTETADLLREYPGNPFDMDRTTVAHNFVKTARATGIKMSAHTLRSIFAREMSRAGVQDRYIDAFCGRIPGSVLARSYSDFSPEALKEVYERANIKIL